MDDPQRGRSPSQGAQARISHSRSPVGHRTGHSPSPSRFDHSTSLTTEGYPDFTNPNPNTASSAFTNPSQFGDAQSRDLNNSFLNNPSVHTTQSAADYPAGGATSTITPGFLDSSLGGSDANFNDQLFQNNTTAQDHQAIDPRFLDPQLLDDGPTLGDGGNTSDLLDSMATAQQHHSPTPPHLVHSMQSNGFPGGSPVLDEAFNAQQHARQASLDPSSAAYPQNQQGWAAGAAFKSHRRSPSDTYSDISSQHASPYLGNTDSFDPLDQSSPLIQPQQDPSTMQTAMGFEQFSLSENQLAQHQAPAHISPGHSPHISPQLMPQQQQLPAFNTGTNFSMQQPLSNQFTTPDMNAYNAQNFLLQQGLSNGGSDIGQASQMPLPEFKVDAAPESHMQHGYVPYQQRHNALSPPDRTRNRTRAASDPYGKGSRPTSPIGSRPRSPSLNPPTISIASVEAGLVSEGGLAPLDLLPAGSGSRSSSPGADLTTFNARSASRSSSVSSANGQRDKILDLADPSRPSATSGDGAKRVQKHPATFQCHLCPKRFTRAYNLRSHLRTHTDERPFVCTVCGKAFARQHDRKRHEGLHSGEKKFVCRGSLKSGNSWGCGRRFARADALGRHFRSEAGRVCIKPLLDEEASERQASWLEQQNAQAGAMVMPQGAHDPNQLLNPSGIGAGAMNPYLPAAILQQYPVLAGMQLDAPVGEDDVSGRSSYDASSGGEFEDYDDGSFVPGVAPWGTAQAGGSGGGEWTSDYEGHV